VKKEHGACKELKASSLFPRMLRNRKVPVPFVALLMAGCGAIRQAAVVAHDGNETKPLGAPLAVGASIQPEVSFDTQTGAAQVLSLVSGRADVIAYERGRLWAKAPGVAPILVLTPERVVVDFYHLATAQATRLALHRIDDEGKDLGEVQEGIDLLVGDSLYLSPRIYAEAQPLLGDVSAEWSSVPPIVDVLRRGIPSTRRLVARRAGEAKLSVSLGGTRLELPVRVFEAPSSQRGVSAGAKP
jgi:hypothetical protein